MRNNKRSAQRAKSRPSRFSANQHSRALNVRELLRSNYMDIQKQAERVSYRFNATSEKVFNERYSHIAIDPGVPKGYYKDEPTFKHYKEINQHMLATPKGQNISEEPTTSRTPLKNRTPEMLTKSREINYSELRYSVEDLHLNFQNERMDESKRAMKLKLTQMLFNTQSRSKYDINQLSGLNISTSLFGRVLSNLQNSRIAVR
jgi:hypothetical protein